MTAVELRVLLAFGAMILACGGAFAVGDRSVRKAAGLLAFCWTAATIAEFFTQRQAEPVITADVACGLGLLILASRSNRAWLWILVGLECLLFFTHAALYRTHQPPVIAEIVANDVLAFGGLVILVGAALWPRRPWADALSRRL